MACVSLFILVVMATHRRGPNQMLWSGMLDVRGTELVHRGVTIDFERAAFQCFSIARGHRNVKTEILFPLGIDVVAFDDPCLLSVSLPARFRSRPSDVGWQEGYKLKLAVVVVCT